MAPSRGAVVCRGVAGWGGSGRDQTLTERQSGPGREGRTQTGRETPRSELGAARISRSWSRSPRLRGPLGFTQGCWALGGSWPVRGSGMLVGGFERNKVEAERPITTLKVFVPETKDTKPGRVVGGSRMRGRFQNNPGSKVPVWGQEVEKEGEAAASAPPGDPGLGEGDRRGGACCGWVGRGGSGGQGHTELGAEADRTGAGELESGVPGENSVQRAETELEGESRDPETDRERERERDGETDGDTDSARWEGGLRPRASGDVSFAVPSTRHLPLAASHFSSSKKRQALKSHLGFAPSKGMIQDQTLEKDGSTGTRDRTAARGQPPGQALGSSSLGGGALHVQGLRFCPQGQFANSQEGRLLVGIQGPWGSSVWKNVPDIRDKQSNGGPKSDGPQQKPPPQLMLHSLPSFALPTPSPSPPSSSPLPPHPQPSLAPTPTPRLGTPLLLQQGHYLQRWALRSY
ncbi:hypothetical protein Cadr_000008650 [Camelus dromedarius]|uniref:Uncharacterized protein n=1 Tax=Camelus dromedarius TaxID=9838 RepID=A0A5N4DYL2_CAMDR|nr:hypothetical protein Cadr_000008650 [Camelus dromedarius]